MLHADTEIDEMQSGAENKEQVSTPSVCLISSFSPNSQIRQIDTGSFSRKRMFGYVWLQSLLNAMGLVASVMIFSSLWGLLGLRLGVYSTFACARSIRTILCGALIMLQSVS